MCCCSCCILHEVWKKKKRHVYLGCISGSSPASLGCPNKLGREQILMRIPTWLSATCPFGLWLWGLFDILSLQHSAAPSLSGTCQCLLGLPGPQLWAVSQPSPSSHGTQRPNRCSWFSIPCPASYTALLLSSSQGIYRTCLMDVCELIDEGRSLALCCLQ